MKLIDKDKVVEKINSVLDSFDPNEITSGRYELVKLRNFLDTLEVFDTLEIKEEDLEKEVRKFIKDNCTSLEEPDEFLTTLMQLDDMVIFAKHFYELGLNVKKE